MNVEQGSQSADSLFDFFYIDKERVSSISSQILGHGVITSLKRTTSDTDKINKTVEFNAKFAKAGTGFDETLTSSQEKVYDASWSLPLNLLDSLFDLDAIKKDFINVSLGDLVLATGHIKIFDIGMMYKLIPAAKFLSRKEKNKSARHDVVAFDSLEQVLKVLPQSIQIDMSTEDNDNLWMTVNHDDLTIPTGDIMLKYGPIIPGRWHVLGIVDAHAHDKYENDSAPYPQFDNEIRNCMDMVGLSVRMQIGRPTSSYGITPLIIFRKIK